MEPEGGDPACWAHLFDEMGAGGDQEPDDFGAVDTTRPSIVQRGVADLPAIVRAASGHGAAWTAQSEDLQINLIVFTSGDGVAEHVNNEVDVLLVGIAGMGAVTVEGVRHVLRAGHALVIPKGVRREVQSLSDPFAYLTCHRPRAGIWPSSRSGRDQ